MIEHGRRDRQREVDGEGCRKEDSLLVEMAFWILKVAENSGMSRLNISKGRK